MKEQEDATKEAFDGTAQAEFLFGPGGRQAGTVLLPLGIPGDDGCGVQGGVNPGDEAQAPIGRVQADETRTDGIDPHGPFQQGARKGSIMHVGAGEQKEERQALAATEQGMHAIAAQERAWMLSRGMTDRRIWVGPSPRQNGGAIDNQTACPNQPTADGGQHAQHEERLAGRCASDACSLPLLGRAGNAWVAIRTQRQAARQG